MSDPIERQAAIDAVSRGCKEFRGIFAECEKNLNELPPAQSVTKDTNVPINDCISRQAAMDALYKMLHDCFWADDEELDAVITTLNDLPSAQPDIIACADCKHWICHDRRCGYWNHGVKPLDWCCHAERRTDGSD